MSRPPVSCTILDAISGSSGHSRYPCESFQRDPVAPRGGIRLLLAVTHIQRGKSSVVDQIEFRCETCGSPHVSIPSELTPRSEVLCGRCSRPIGTWTEYCQTIALAVSNDKTHGHVVADPLMLRH